MFIVNLYIPHIKMFVNTFLMFIVNFFIFFASPLMENSGICNIFYHFWNDT